MAGAGGSGSMPTDPNAKFDPNFTKNVIDSIGPKCTPRLRKVLGSLITHMHDFARENEITVDEWMNAVQMMNWAGKMSDEKRNEGQLVCDVFGLESLVDEITYKVAAENKDAPTATAILGPFYRHDHPVRKNGDSIIDHCPDDGQITFMHGTVMDFTSRKPVVGAEIDVWQASTNGYYEQQDPDQPDLNLRGRFKTDENGYYEFYCLVPTPYPIPYDGPAGKLLQLMDRHPFRPAHIHLLVQHPDHQPLTTQIFDKNDKYLENDSVFAVKDSLVVDFTPLESNDKAKLELKYDVLLAPKEVAAQQSVRETNGEV